MRPLPATAGSRSKQGAVRTGRLVIAAFLAATWLASSAGGTPSLLEKQTTIVFDGQQLGGALARLSSTLEIPLWIDRRIDVGAPVSLAARDESVGEILKQLGAAQNGAPRELAGLVYFGPQQAADELATLMELNRRKLASLPAERRSAWLAKRAWSIPAAAEPKELVRELAQSAGTRVDGAAPIPHDLWPARNLPPLSVIDRMTLVLAGFELAPEISRDGRELTVEPIRRPVEIVRQYSGSGRPAEAVRSVVDELAGASPAPAVRVTRRGNRLEVAGRIEIHQRIAAHLTGQSAPRPSEAPPSPGGERVFTLVIDAKPLGPVLDQLAAQLGLAVAWDDALVGANPQATATLVSCRVEKATLDELLAALVDSAGLAFERQDNRVTIRQK